MSAQVLWPGWESLCMLFVTAFISNGGMGLRQRELAQVVAILTARINDDSEN